MLNSLRKILWPTDFSELSLLGGRYARSLCEYFDAQLHIIHIIPPLLTADFSAMLPAGAPLPAVEPEMLEACKEKMDQVVTEHFENDQRVVREALFGNPWSSVCEYAQQHDIDLIVVATHGRTGLEHAIIGSTTERIVQHAPCPVLTVKSTGRNFLNDE
ncbi:MAG: universal stress protein [Planctomycetota bacterium]